MSRKYSVLFVALAFVVAMAAGAWAWTIPTFSGADQTSVPNTEALDAVGVSLDYDGTEYGTWTAEPRWASRDITAATEICVSASSVNPISDEAFVFSADNPEFGASGLSIDGILLYAGRATREVPLTFSADSSGVGGARFTLNGFTFLGGSSTFDVFSDDGRVSNVFRFAGTPCEGGTCNTFYHTEMTVASRDQSGAGYTLISSDMGIFTYIPCGDYEKEWQVFPFGRSVLPYDMVRYGDAVTGTNALDLGYYVVERSLYDMNQGTNQVEVLAERILNKSGTIASADWNHFDWLPLGEETHNATGFLRRSADVQHARAMVDTTYLMHQDWDTNRTDTFGYTWYSWVNVADPTNYTIFAGETYGSATNARVNIPAGFARYYAHSADVTVPLEMCFTGDTFCQTLTIVPQIWSEDAVCATNNVTDGCFTFTSMSADASVVTDLATWTGIASPTFVADSLACGGNCEGTINYFADYVATAEPWVSLANCGSLCQAASVDVLLSNATCNDDNMDIFLAKVNFNLRPFRICDDQVRLDIATALAKLTDPANKPDNLGPVDAFLNNAAFDASLGNDLDIVVVGSDGKYYELSEMAKANSFVDPSKDYQGLKNFFDVWATTPTQSVAEAWGTGALTVSSTVDLSFYVAIVDGNAPEGEDPVQVKKGYFLIYAGEGNSYMSYFAAMANFDPTCGTTPTPTPVVPQMTVSSSPSGTTEAATCSTFTKESFGTDAWTAILAALEITDESAYTFSLSGVDCLDSTTSGLTAAQDVTFAVTYEDGVTTAGDAVTGRMVFVYNVTDSKYDMLPEVASEVSIATEQTKNTVIAEGSKYDANEATDALKVGFSLVSVVATPVNTPTTAPSSGGGSGCSFGFAPLALVLLAPLALLKK